MKKYNVNDIISVTVTSIETYGAFVKIDEEYTGLIHISEINGKFIKNINDYFKINNVLKAKILEIDEDKKQIKLTLKNVRKKKRKNKLYEVGQGFNLLEENLPKWIKSAKNEMEIVKNKKNG